MADEIEFQIKSKQRGNINSKKSFTMGKHNRKSKFSQKNLKGNYTSRNNLQ